MAAQIGIEYESFEATELSAFGQTGKHLYIVYTDESEIRHVLEGGTYGADRTHITIREGLLSRDTPPASAVDGADGTYIYKSASNTSTYVALNVNNAVTIWQDMRLHAQAIEAAQLEYVFSPGPNSNSVASSLLNDVGFDVEQLLGISIPDDVAPSNIFNKVMAGEMQLSSTGFIGVQNVLPSVTSDSTTSNGSSSMGSSTGTSGNDSLTGTAGNDAIDGGAGIDVLVLGGNHANYTLASHSAGFILSGADGSDTLANVERLQFTDTNIAIDLDGNAGNAAKILGAVFGRESVGNTTYAGIGLHYLDSGMSYESLMQLALDAALGPNASHRAVVDLLYSNLVGMAPSDADAVPFVGWLEGGMTHAQLGVYAADYELNTQNINLTGLGQTGLEFVPFTG